MNDRKNTEQPKQLHDMQLIDAIEADLVAAINAAKNPKLSKRKLASLESDVLFHFNELVAVEMHTGNAAARCACSSIIDAHAFDRTRCVSTIGIRL